MKHRLKFLSKCYDLGIVPETLKVKPPQNNACQNNSTRNNYITLANSTSMKNLKYAKNDVEITLIAEETNFQEYLQRFLLTFNKYEKSHLKNLV